ncbi:MAG: class I SAM-dependent methyltransferase [Candidatus Omnitrophota bacterium]
MAFGRELAEGNTNLKGKIFYRLFGVNHMGARIRKFYLTKAVEKVENRNAIFDAGCGSGCYSFYFSHKFPTSHIVCVDMDGEKIANCQKIQNKLKRNNLEFIQGDLKKFTPQGQFNLIYSVDVLEHIDDDEKVLQNFNRALRPEGILLLHLPRKQQLHKLHFKRFKNRINDGHVRTGYLKEEVITKLSRAGFVIKEFKNTCGKFAALSTELQLLINETGWMRSVLRVLSFPFLITLAYLDTLLTLNDNKDHQGFLIKAVKIETK